MGRFIFIGWVLPRGDKFLWAARFMEIIFASCVLGVSGGHVAFIILLFQFLHLLYFFVFSP